jgi:hypothetical protein
VLNIAGHGDFFPEVLPGIVFAVVVAGDQVPVLSVGGFGGLLGGVVAVAAGGVRFFLDDDDLVPAA